MISAVILAAGASTRMGRPKQLLQLGRKTMLEHVIDHVAQAGVGEIILVLGAHREQIERSIASYPVSCVFNPHFASGQGSSVAAGATAVDQAAGGILFMVGDQPLIPTEFIDRVVAAYRRSDALIVRPANGMPTVFDISLRAELEQLSGDTGGRQLMDKYRDRMLIVPGCPEAGCSPGTSLDVDTEEDYRRVLAYWDEERE